MYSSINSTKSATSDAGNVGESRLRLQGNLLLADQCLSASRGWRVPVFVCSLRSSNHVTDMRTVSFVRLVAGQHAK